MSTAKRKAGAPEPPGLEAPPPEVIVDFRFDRGVLHVAVANVSGVPAHDVSVQFDKPFRGLGGRQETSSLRLFRRLPFLAPYKTVETLLDTTSAYFARREPTLITASISYRDAQRRLHERRMKHDLGVYRDVAYLVNAGDGGCPAGRSPGPGTLTSAAKEENYGGSKR